MIYYVKLSILLSAYSSLAGFGVAQAQYQDPFHCLPPTGQQLYEIAANNSIGTYRRDPTKANKQKACTQSRKVVDVYQKAVKACRQNTCETADYQTICDKKSEKHAEWKTKSREMCGGKT